VYVVPFALTGFRVTACNRLTLFLLVPFLFVSAFHLRSPRDWLFKLSLEKFSFHRCNFYDADDFHSPENKLKMSSGELIIVSEMDLAKRGLFLKALIKGRGAEIFRKFHPPPPSAVRAL
jgi:hypothetical protein